MTDFEQNRLDDEETPEIGNTPVVTDSAELPADSSFRKKRGVNSGGVMPNIASSLLPNVFLKFSSSSERVISALLF